MYRHEQTLSGPKKDRLELLRHTRAQLEQLFMLYPDPQGEIDRILDEAAKANPTCEVSDEYGAAHRDLADRRSGPYRAHSAVDGGQEAAHRRRPSSL